VHAPRTIGDYEVLEQLGRGGMGVVYRVRHPRSGQELALKCMLTPGNAESRRRFEIELEVLRRLRHPNLIQIHELGEDSGRPFVVMQLARGSSLQERLERQGPLPPREAVELVGKVAMALDHAHTAGVLHRDVKPDNVLLHEGQPLLTDFGLAKDLDASRAGPSVTGRFMGTPGYWPPEQASGRLDLIGPRSDVYGLGGLLYAALTGLPPFHGESVLEVLTMTINEPPTRPSKLRPEIGPRLDELCLRCLAKAPEERYPSARALAEALQTCLEGDQEPASSSGRAGWLVAGALLTSLLALGAVWAWRTGPGPEEPEPEAPQGPAPTDEAQRSLAASRASLEALDHSAAWAGFGEAARLFAALGDPGREREARMGRVEAALISDDPSLLEAAGDELARAFALRPIDAPLLLLRARHHAACSRPEQALRDLGLALRYAPRDADLLLARAEVHLLRGDVPGALEDLERAWSNSRTPPPPLLARYAEVLTLRGRYRHTLTVLGAAAQTEGLEQCLARARAHLRLKEPGQAEASLVRARSLAPDDARVEALGIYLRLLLAPAAEKRTLRPEALDLMARAPSCQDARLTLLASLDQASLREHRELARQAVHGALDPLVLIVWATLEEADSPDRALQSLELAIPALEAEGLAWGLYRRAEIMATRADWRASLADAQAAMTADPLFAAPCYTAGFAANRLQEHRAAVEAFGRYLELAGPHYAAWLAVANASLALGDSARAIEAYTQAHEINPREEVPLAMRATARYQARDFAGAVEDYTSGLAFNPTDGSTMFNRGNAYLQLGFLEQALADFDRCLEPRNLRGAPSPRALEAAAQYSRATAFMRRSSLGDHERARQALERSLLLDPSRRPQIEQALAELDSE
jgi:tetratricopeptide (TPR) repeat protein